MDMKHLQIVFLSSGYEMSAAYFRPFFLAKYLVQRGHRICFIASSRKATTKMSRKHIDGVDVILLPSFIKEFFVPSRTRGLFTITTSLLQTPLNCVLQTILNSEILHTFDAIFPQNALPTLLCKAYKFLQIHRKKLFVDWDDWWGQGGLLSQYRTPQLIGRLLELLEAKLPLLSDGVTVIGEALRNRALQMGVKPNNLFVLPNGANVDIIKPLDTIVARQKLGLPMDKIIYTQVGILDHEAFRLLILAHKMVIKSFPNTILMFVGKIHSQHLDIIRSSNTTQNIVYAGFQPDNKYPLYLAASDAFVLPLQDTIFDRARHHIRLGDYLAAGRPVITTALPQMKKMVLGCGCLSKPDDPEDLARKILRVVQNPDLREKMGKRARELAESKYSWKTIAEHLEDFYKRFL